MVNFQFPEQLVLYSNSCIVGIKNEAFSTLISTLKCFIPESLKNGNVGLGRRKVSHQSRRLLIILWKINICKFHLWFFYDFLVFQSVSSDSIVIHIFLSCVSMPEFLVRFPFCLQRFFKFPLMIQKTQLSTLSTATILSSILTKLL